MKTNPVIAGFFFEKKAVDSLFGKLSYGNSFFEPPFWLKAVPALAVLSSPARFRQIKLDDVLLWDFLKFYYLIVA